MPNIQVKDVPAEVHAVLRDRAARAHQSLQEYLLDHLATFASQPSLDEVLDRAAVRPGGSPASDIIAAIRGDRDRR